MELKEKCYFVKGHKNATIYDLKEEKVYSINEEGKEILCKVLGKNVADFSKIENEFINELKKLNLIEEARIHKKNNIEKSNPNLKYVWLEITEACNLNCVHCYGEFGKPKINHSELISTSEWKLIIDKLREEKCGEIQLIGGEPTVNADFIEILNYAHQKGMKRIDVFTNGTQINEKNISELKKDNVSVRVSLYGHNDEIHDKITQVKGSFEKTTKALALLKKYNIPTRIAVVIMRENEDYINDIKNYIKSIGYDYTGYDTIRPSCANEISKHSVSNPNILESRYNTEPIFYTSQKSFMDNHFYNSCWNGKLAIKSNGDIIPCIFARDNVVGNIKKNTLEEIKNAIIEKWQITKDNIEVCKDCEFRYCCHDCRPIAKGITGNDFSKYPRCCYNPYTGEWKKVSEITKELKIKN